MIDFEQFGPFEYTWGPVQIGTSVNYDVVWSALRGTPSVIGSGGDYGLGDNGFWTDENAYTATNNPEHWMMYTFSGPVSGVGGFVNYAPGVGTPLIEALGADLTVLESYNLATLAPISTPGARNGGAFRGILRGSADIRAYRVSGAYMVLDNLSFVPGQPVPEPASLTLLALGLAGLGARRWVHFANPRVKCIRRGDSSALRN